MLPYHSLIQEIQVPCTIFSKLCPVSPRKKRNTQSWKQIIQKSLPLSTTWVYITLQPVPNQFRQRALAQSGQVTCPGSPSYLLELWLEPSSTDSCSKSLSVTADSDYKLWLLCLVLPKTSCITSAFPLLWDPCFLIWKLGWGGLYYMKRKLSGFTWL